MSIGRFVKFTVILSVFAAALACATAYDKRGVYHRVRGGENIQKIARFYHVPVQDLAEWNNIQDPKEIQTGLKLYIPDVKHKISLKHKKLPEAEKSGFDAPIQFERSRFIWPVSGPVLSQFGIRNGRRHDGVDIKAHAGTPIKAASEGGVVFSDRLRGYGNMLIIKHKEKFFTVYAHNSRNLVKKGQKVAKGDVIGYVGSTGRATGPHLHFEVREGQKARNPLFLLPAIGPKTVEVAKASKFEKKGRKAGKIEKVDGDDKGDAGKKPDKKWSRRKNMMDELKTKRANDAKK